MLYLSSAMINLKLLSRAPASPQEKRQAAALFLLVILVSS